MPELLLNSSGFTVGYMLSTGTLMGMLLYDWGVKEKDKGGSGLVLPKLIFIRIKGFPRITKHLCTACVFVCLCVCLTV